MTDLSSLSFSEDNYDAFCVSSGTSSSELLVGSTEDELPSEVTPQQFVMVQLGRGEAGAVYEIKRGSRFIRDRVTQVRFKNKCVGWSQPGVWESLHQASLELSEGFSAQDQLMDWVQLDLKYKYFDQIVESPFERLVLIEKKRVDRLLSSFEEESGLPYASAIRERIQYLIGVSLEDDPDEFPISALSISTFISCMDRLGQPKKPSVVFTPKKNLQIQWNLGEKGRLVVECLLADRLRYALVLKDEKRPGNPVISSGFFFVWNLEDFLNGMNLRDYIYTQI